GQLARVFKGRALFSLIISDVIGDPLDVIASGPTAADPTTFSDALAVLERYALISAGQVPSSVLHYLQEGAAGKQPETPKSLPGQVRNYVIGNNARALAAAQAKAEALSYRVLNLGAFLEGEARTVAILHTALVQSIRADKQPLAAPVCILSG